MAGAVSGDLYIWMANGVSYKSYTGVSKSWTAHEQNHTNHCANSLRCLVLDSDVSGWQNETLIHPALWAPKNEARDAHLENICLISFIVSPSEGYNRVSDVFMKPSNENDDYELKKTRRRISEGKGKNWVVRQISY